MLTAILDREDGDKTLSNGKYPELYNPDVLQLTTDPLRLCSEAGVRDRPSEDLLLEDTDPARVSLAKVPRAPPPSTSST